MQEQSDHEQGTGPDDARSRTRRWLAGVLLGTLVLAIGGGVLGFALASRRHRPGHHPSWAPLIAILAALAVTLAVTGVILWRLLNRPAYQRVMRYPWRRRMRVAKALRRGDPIEPEDRAVADAIVAVMRTQRAIYWFQPVLIATWVLMALTRHGVARWLYAGYALVITPILAYGLQMRRRTIRNWDAASSRSAGDPPDTVGA
jgi:MFS family permease